MSETYKDHEICIIQDNGGYFARIDGHDEPLEDAESKEQAMDLARQLVDQRWC